MYSQCTNGLEVFPMSQSLVPLKVTFGSCVPVRHLNGPMRLWSSGVLTLCFGLLVHRQGTGKPDRDHRSDFLFQHKATRNGDDV